MCSSSRRGGFRICGHGGSALRWSQRHALTSADGDCWELGYCNELWSTRPRRTATFGGTCRDVVWSSKGVRGACEVVLVVADGGARAVLRPTMTGSSSIRFLGEFGEASGILTLCAGGGYPEVEEDTVNIRQCFPSESEPGTEGGRDHSNRHPCSND